MKGAVAKMDERIRDAVPPTPNVPIHWRPLVWEFFLHEFCTPEWNSPSSWCCTAGPRGRASCWAASRPGSSSTCSCPVGRPNPSRGIVGPVWAHLQSQENKAYGIPLHWWWKIEFCFRTPPPPPPIEKWNKKMNMAYYSANLEVALRARSPLDRQATPFFYEQWFYSSKAAFKKVSKKNV